MTDKKNIISVLYFIITALVLNACSSQQGGFTSPAGYNLNNPEKIIMPESLLEISGIAFNNGNNDTLYAVQDEDGKLFYLQPGAKNAASVKFAKHGDFEDLAIWKNMVIMLRSDGELYSFPLHDTKVKNNGAVKEWKNLLPLGEYEGVYAPSTASRLYVLCKHCKMEKSFAGGYSFSLAADSIFSPQEFNIDAKEIGEKAGVKKLKFHPSGLAENPFTHQWYILSATNKMLVITNEAWKVQEVHLLDPALFRQPEGIAFDKQRNLYISNEGDKMKNGNVLRIKYSAKTN